MTLDSRACPKPRRFAISHVIMGLARTSRPLGWIAALALYRIGMAYGAVQDSTVTLLLSIVITFPFCLYLFGLNDLADQDSDADNPRKGNWIHGASSPIPHTLSRWAPWIGGAMVASIIPWLPLAAALLLSGILFLSRSYSSPPIRLKEIPIVDGLVTASIMIGLLCLGHLSGPSSLPLATETFTVAPTLVGLHIFASVVDVDADKTAGHRTLAVRTSPRFAGIVALALSLVSTSTIPWLDYSPPITAYLILQPIVFVVWMLFGRRFTGHRAISLVGLAGLLTLLYLALVYVRQR